MNIHNKNISLNYDFKTEYYWDEIFSSYLKIVSYLKENKIGEELSKIMTDDNSNELNIDKLKSIIAILDKALLDNPSENLNIFFLEFYRLSSIYFFTTDNANRAFEIIDKFISSINLSFKGLAEELLDINLVVIRDKFELNKAQMQFWQGRFVEAEEIFYKKLVYFQSDTTDIVYIYKMTNMYLSIITYKAWLHYFSNDNEEAEKYFLLATQINKDYKTVMLKNVEEIGIIEISKRKVKILHQYLMFLTTVLKTSQNTLNQRVLTKYEENAYATIKEIVKILNKQNFEFDKEIQRIYMIFYYMYGAYFASIVRDENGRIDMEMIVINLVNSLIENYNQHNVLKEKFNIFVFDNILIFSKLINRYKSICDQKITINERGIFKKKVESFLDCFDDSGKAVVEDNIEIYENINQYSISSESPINNFALANLKKFSQENANTPINQTIDELYIVDYIINKFLYVLAQSIADSKENNKYFLNPIKILESFNGYLLLEEDGFKLYTQNTIIIIENLNNELFSDKNSERKFSENFIVINSENNIHFFTKNTFIYTHESTFNVFLCLYFVNLLYSLKLYRACVILIKFILNDLNEVQLSFKKTNKSKTLLAFCEFYCFLTFLAVKIYMTISEFSLAITLLENISKYEDNEHVIMLNHILFAICLSKIRYCDMAAILFQEALNIIEKSLSNDLPDKKDVNSIAKHKETIDMNKIPEPFLNPLKMLISSLNVMKLKSIEKFVAQISDKSPILCNYCDYTLNPNPDTYKTCTKCKRGKYCNIKCMKKNKSHHEIICFKYFVYFTKVNDLVNG